MARAAITLRLFTDENVPDSVGRYLRGRGHSVYRAKAHLAEGSPDQIVATTAMEDGRILVSQDKDFNHQRFAQPRFARLSRIGLVGAGPTLVRALKEHMHLIEAQWAHAQRSGAARMIVHLQVGQIRFRA
jgi:hypothetical protein